MNHLFIFLADADPRELLGNTRSWGDPAKRETLLFLAAVLVVILVIFAWAVFIRKPSRRRRHHRHHGSDHADRLGAPEAREADPVDDDDDDSGDAGAEPSPRRRRRRRGHRPRNPTLAETGGLPPVRKPPPVGPQPS